MHPGAREFVARHATADPVSVIEIGSRNINGTVRDLFPRATWTGIDLRAGPCVDVVGDAMLYEPPEPVDLVVCCEVLEHAADWQDLVCVTYGWLKSGGHLIVTCAGPGRNAHSAIDGGPLRVDEHYENISTNELNDAMKRAGFVLRVTEGNQYWHDTYGIGWKH